MAVDLQEILPQLRVAGGDTAAVEVKSARGGLPQSLTRSLSALANLPGGGLLILGLDESDDFRPVGISNVQALKQGLGNKARSFQPPVRLEIADAQVDGKAVVVAEVHECDPAAKPCRIAATGRAYIRSYDGDFELSALEEQGFLRARTAPACDREPVPGAAADDLDDALVTRWVQTVRERSPRGLGRFGEAEMLLRGGVITRDGVLTRAGLLALGTYPQQHFPRLVVHAANLREAGPRERARNVRTIDGPIPTMLTQTMAWLRENLASRVVGDRDGAVRDRYEYPLEALRELVANALVHRDLDSWSDGRAIELRLHRDRLDITNPGGLYGITVDRLTTEHVTSARNPRLVSLCENVRDTVEGARVVEALASGLTKVAQDLALADLPPARFFDTGIAFTVALSSVPSAPTHSVGEPRRATPGEGTNLHRLYAALLEHGEQTVAELSARTGIAEPSARRALTHLRGNAWNLVTAYGGRGKRTTYAARQPSERKQ